MGVAMSNRDMECGLTTEVDFIRAIDGDTIQVKIERTFNIRLRDIDIIELKEQGGKEARDFVTKQMEGARIIKVFIPSNDPHKLMDMQSFERLVADVYVDGRNLADVLRTAGYEKQI
jgi:endonuclease YncB( thermonuclease family)